MAETMVEETLLTEDGHPKKQPERWLDKILSKIPLERFQNPPPVVAVLRLSGVIGQIGAYRQGLTLSEMEEEIKAAFEPRRNLKAVVLAVNSPGGSPVQSELISKRIRALSEAKEIPVVAFVEDVAASGGYWLACTGDEIYASRSSIVGSIGVIAAGFGFVDAIKKLGIERRVYTQGENKSILDPFKPKKDSDIAIVKTAQKDIHEAFKQLVRERRKDKLKGDEEKLFSGEFWSGQQALDLGLIDGINDMYSLMQERYGEEVKFRKVQSRKGWLQRKLGFLGSSFSTSIAHALANVIEERSLWGRFGR